MMNNVPEIRFNGFIDAWEQRKLGEVAPLQRGFDLPKSEMIGGDYPVVMSNGILHYHNEYKAKAPGVVTGRSGTIGKLHFIESDYWPHNTALWVTDYMGNFPKFIYHLYSIMNLSRFGTGTGVPTLNRNDVHDEYTHIPCTMEQKKLSYFLDTLDILIANQKRKFEGLKQLKKSYLQKMFPQAGETTPKVRFAGFTKPWETRKLENVLFERKVRHKITDSTPLLAFAAGQGVIDRSERKTNNRDFLTHDSTTKVYLLTKKDDIVYNPSNLKYGAIDRNKYGTGVISPIYITFETTEIPSFVELIVTSEGFKERALQYEEGTVTKRQSVKPELLLSLDVEIAPSHDEQSKIGTFFVNIDTQISTQQAKIDRLRQLKLAYLQKMFL